MFKQQNLSTQKEQEISSYQLYPYKIFQNTTDVIFNNVPYTWFCIIEMSSILIGIFLSLFWALIFHYESVTKTHCEVYNWFPSFSSVIGNGWPEIYIWRMGILGLLPCRIFEIFSLYWFINRSHFFNDYEKYIGKPQYNINNNKNYDIISENDEQQVLLQQHPLIYEDSDSDTTLYNNMHTISNIDDNSINMNSVSKNDNSINTTDNNHNDMINTDELDTSISSLTTSNQNTEKFQTQEKMEKMSLLTNKILYQIQWRPHKTTYITLLHSLSMGIEYFGLTLLSFVSSTEVFLVHEYGFVIFLIASQLHVWLHFYLTWELWQQSKSSIVYKLQWVKLCLYIINILSIYGIYYFYTLHTKSCQNHIYSFFGICEYIMVLSNTFFHLIKSLQFSYFASFSFSLTVPNIALLSSNNNTTTPIFYTNLLSNSTDNKKYQNINSFQQLFQTSLNTSTEFQQSNDIDILNASQLPKNDIDKIFNKLYISNQLQQDDIMVLQQFVSLYKHYCEQISQQNMIKYNSDNNQDFDNIRLLHSQRKYDQECSASEDVELSSLDII